MHTKQYLVCKNTKKKINPKNGHLWAWGRRMGREMGIKEKKKKQEEKSITALLLSLREGLGCLGCT